MEFDNLFKSMITYMFYLLNIDHYSKFAKVSLFILLLVLPIVIIVIGFFTIKLLDFVDPIPELVSDKLPEPQLENITSEPALHLVS